MRSPPFDWRTTPFYRAIVFVYDEEGSGSVHDIINTPRTPNGLRNLRRHIVDGLPIFGRGESCKIVYEDSTLPDEQKDVTRRFTKVIAENTIGL